jgi:hypothetical protein
MQVDLIVSRSQNCGEVATESRGPNNFCLILDVFCRRWFTCFEQNEPPTPVRLLDQGELWCRVSSLSRDAVPQLNRKETGK